MGITAYLILQVHSPAWSISCEGTDKHEYTRNQNFHTKHWFTSIKYRGSFETTWSDGVCLSDLRNNFSNGSNRFFGECISFWSTLVIAIDLLPRKFISSCNQFIIFRFLKYASMFFCIKPTKTYQNCLFYFAIFHQFKNYVPDHLNPFLVTLSIQLGIPFHGFECNGPSDML